MMRIRFALVAAALTTASGLAACSSDGGGGPAGPESPFNLLFRGDASFQGPHGGQTIHVLVLESGEVVAATAGMVSATADPSFSFDFPDVLDEGEDYTLEYWIDSNFGGGTEGVCDDPDVDHQWKVEIAPATEDVTLADTHRPSETEPVCSDFAFDLSFSGDASFQGAHGGQSIHVTVVDEDRGVTVATDSGTVSATEDPTFSFDFPGLLVLNEAYHVDYWIDSNFGGGTEGVCDPPDVDHQWRIQIDPVSEDVTIADTHRPSETQQVCSTASGTGDPGDPGNPGY